LCTLPWEDRKVLPVNGTTGSTTIFVRILLGILIAVTLLAGPLQAAESGDAQLFIAGFNAYQKEEYGVAVQKLSRMLKEFPTSPLHDMNLFWLARASYRTGDRPEAARIMSRFLKEYPDHPLKGTVEDDLLKLAMV
jgi:TolA-binding protein